jgi:hypothetical protein
MKKIIFILIVMLNLSAFSQRTKVLDSTFRISREQMEELYKHPRANVINFHQVHFLGNFVSVDTKESALKFTGNSVTKSGGSVGARVKVGVDDGYLSLFRNTQLNYLVGGDVQFNFTPNNTSFVHFERDEQTQKNKLVDAKSEWMAIEYNVQSRSFQQFDSSKIITEAFPRAYSTAHRILLKFNNFGVSKSGRSTFVSLGLGLIIEDNFEELQRRLIEQSVDYDSFSPEIKEPKRFFVHDGEYKNEVVYLALSVNFFLQPFRKSSNAFRFSFDLKSASSQFVDVGLGYLMTFKNNLNLELYGKLNNILNEQFNTSSISIHDNIGIRFAYPLTFRSKEIK